MTKPQPPHAVHLLGRHREPDWMLLGCYLDGDCSGAQAEVIRQWAAADPANGQLLESLRRVWVDAGILRPDMEVGWRAMRERMTAASLVPTAPRRVSVWPTTEATGAEARETRETRARPRLPLVLVAAAAAVIALLGGSFFWRERQAVRREIAAASVGPEYATRRGQRAQVTLVDGTRVWLNVDSRVRLLPGYGTTARDVALEGQAYFVVRHDPRRPFRVHTRDAVAEDLGTEFSVRGYAEDAEIVVVVASGRVVMRRDSAQAAATGVELRRGQMGRLNRAGRVSVTDNVSLAGAFEWREGRMGFVGRPLAELLRELERWYDLDIRLEDPSLALVPVTFSLGSHTPDQALGVVASVVDLRYTREGRLARLSPKRVRH